ECEEVSLERLPETPVDVAEQHCVALRRVKVLDTDDQGVQSRARAASDAIAVGDYSRADRATSSRTQNKVGGLWTLGELRSNFGILQPRELPSQRPGKSIEDSEATHMIATSSYSAGARRKRTPRATIPVTRAPCANVISLRGGRRRFRLR